MEGTEKWTREVGRLRMHHFNEFRKSGIQVFPKARKSDLKKSWKLYKRILKTRSAPKVVAIKNRKGWIVFRLPRIGSEESLTKILDAMKSMLEGATPL